MSRYILRFRGRGEKPQADVETIRSLPHTYVLDDQSPRMLLVEAPGEELQSVMQLLPDWVMTEERIYNIPDPRPRIQPD